MSISSADTGVAAEQGYTRPGMPDPGSSLHIASLDYYCTFALLTNAVGLASFAVPDPVRFSFSFETAMTQISPGIYQVRWDYSWFDQVTVEADIAYAMSQIVAAVANLLGLTTGEVNQAVLIRRIWTFAPDLQGASTVTGAGSGRVVTTDVMPYPPRASADRARIRYSMAVAVRVTGSDAAHAGDAAYSFGGDWAHATESASHTP